MGSSKILFTVVNSLGRLPGVGPIPDLTVVFFNVRRTEEHVHRELARNEQIFVDVDDQQVTALDDHVSDDDRDLVPDDRCRSDPATRC